MRFAAHVVRKIAFALSPVLSFFFPSGLIMKIAFIGIGQMGREMCGNLLNTGKYDVVVHDAFPAQLETLAQRFPKPRWAESPAECARDADVVLLSLNGPKDVRQVVFGKGVEGSFAGAAAHGRGAGVPATET